MRVSKTSAPPLPFSSSPAKRPSRIVLSSLWRGVSVAELLMLPCSRDMKSEERSSICPRLLVTALPILLDGSSYRFWRSVLPYIWGEVSLFKSHLIRSIAVLISSVKVLLTIEDENQNHALAEQLDSIFICFGVTVDGEPAERFQNPRLQLRLGQTRH